MVETITALVLTVGSGLLLCYWFRYTCLLILTAKTTRDFASEVASLNQLHFPAVQAELTSGSPELDKLQQSLDRDYEILSGLLQRSSEVDIEDRMLQINYKLTKALYRSMGSLSPTTARRALEEMSMMVAHFANSMGERTALGAA